MRSDKLWLFCWKGSKTIDFDGRGSEKVGLLFGLKCRCVTIQKKKDLKNSKPFAFVKSFFAPRVGK